MPIVVVAGASGCPHPTRLLTPICSRKRGKARQVDGAAGAYVWGRRPVTTLLVDGRLEKRQSAMRPAEECRVFMRDHHVGYIHWATYEENRRMMRRNSVNWEGDESMAAIRAGQGLLVALLRCAHC